MAKTILITVDALRADHLSVYGYDRKTMPVLDEVASDGVVFENAFANGPYTRISIPSFMASQHLAYESLADFQTFPSVLSEHGIQTTVIGTQTGIGLVDGEFGFDETIDLGRDEYTDRASASRSIVERAKDQINEPAAAVSQWLQENGADGVYRALRKPYNLLLGDAGFQYLGYTSAESVTNRALEWLENHRDEDYFLWIHYMEGHRPYGVHDSEPRYLDSVLEEDRIRELMKRAGVKPASLTPDDRQLLIDLYDSDLRYCSRHIERLLDWLQGQGLFEDCNLVFSSDHGEEFRDHGQFFHRNYPYDELTHVPLLVRSPGVERTGRIEERRELLDIAPTILDFHLDEVPDVGYRGRHLFSGGERRVISLGQPLGEKPAVAVRTSDWKLVFDESMEMLFDLEADPDERRDVSDDHADVVQELREGVRENLLERNVQPPRQPDDDVDRQQLEALGYMELRE